MAMRVLGVCTEPDGFSAAVVLENRVVAAVEQFKIRKHWSPQEKAIFPKEAILACLGVAEVHPCDIDVMIALTSTFDSATTIIPNMRALGLQRSRLELVDHRIAHAAAAFYSSPFDRAAIIILGHAHEGGVPCFAFGDGPDIELEDGGNNRFRTLGPLYEQISRSLGFNPRTSTKLAWLGAAGEPEFLDVFREVISRGPEQFGADGFIKNIDLQRPHNVAASLQAGTNELVIQMAEDLRRRRNTLNVCVAGHLAENPLLIRDLEQYFGADCVFVPPAPGIESLSIGAALLGRHLERLPQHESRFPFPALGPKFSDSQIKAELDNCKLVSNFLSGDDALVENTSKALAAGSIVGWFQGRCEFGHRALGFRSILANPFTPYIGENINRFLKHRESFHPFLISVSEEAAAEYFHRVGGNARTIASLYVVNDAKRDLLSKYAIQNLYVRVHTVRSEDNPLFWMLLRSLQSLTGHPLLINTSFNLPGEPLVMTPRDAIRTFYSSGLDALAMGRFLVTK